MSELEHYTDYDTRLAAYAVVTRGGEILLALWNEEENKRWTLPGGGVEFHETPEQGAVREVSEETGYDVVLTGLLGVETDVFEPHQRSGGYDRSLKAVRIFYSAEIVGGELTHESDGSTDEARWIALEQIPELPRVSMVDTGLRLLE